MTFTMNSQQLGFSQQVMKKKCHSPKDFNSLKEIPSCYAAYAITIESQKKTTVRVNAILPGQFKSLSIFYMETSSIFGNPASVTIGDNQETDSTGVGDIMISKILGDFSMGTDV